MINKASLSSPVYNLSNNINNSLSKATQGVLNVAKKVVSAVANFFKALGRMFYNVYVSLKTKIIRTSLKPTPKPNTPPKPNVPPKPNTPPPARSPDVECHICKNKMASDNRILHCQKNDMTPNLSSKSSKKVIPDSLRSPYGNGSPISTWTHCTPTQHRFHAECLNTWLKSGNNICPHPYCKQPRPMQPKP